MTVKSVPGSPRGQEGQVKIAEFNDNIDLYGEEYPVFHSPPIHPTKPATTYQSTMQAGTEVLTIEHEARLAYTMNQTNRLAVLIFREADKRPAYGDPFLGPIPDTIAKSIAKSPDVDLYGKEFFFNRQVRYQPW